MSPSPASNPFAVASPSTVRGPPLPARVWVGFLVQRGVRLLLLPTLFALITLLASRELGLPGGAVALVALGFAAIWVPTSIWMAWARFWRPRDDEWALLLTSGEVLDRAAFLHLVRAQATEVGMMCVGMVAMGAAFPLRFGWWGSPALAVTLVAAAWVAAVLWARMWFARAVVRVASNDNQGALDALRRTWLMRVRVRSADTARAVAAQAQVRLGRPDEALATLAPIRRKKAVQIDLLEAMIRLGRGERPTDATLDQQPDNPARKLMHSQLLAMTALHAGDAESVLATTGQWEAARGWLPLRQRRSLDLLEAGAYLLQEQPDRARRALGRSQTTAEDIAWMQSVYPWWAGPLMDLFPVRRGAGSPR